MTTKKLEPKAAKRGYQRTSQEQIAIDKYLARKADSGPRLKVENKNNKIAGIWPHHPNEGVGLALLMGFPAWSSRTTG